MFWPSSQRCILILCERLQKCHLHEASVATRGRPLTRARSAPIWINTGVFTQAITSLAGSTAFFPELGEFVTLCNRLGRWHFSLLWLYSTVCSGFWCVALRVTHLSMLVDQVANKNLAVLSAPVFSILARCFWRQRLSRKAVIVPVWGIMLLLCWEWMNLVE